NHYCQPKRWKIVKEHLGFSKWSPEMSRKAKAELLEGSQQLGKCGLGLRNSPD
ncbi:hypothetical protein RRG08_013769, partial [Elysia crispata]